VIVTTGTGHARDADAIAGDNAQVFRLVDASGQSTAYLTFNHDYPPSSGSRGPSSPRLHPRRTGLQRGERGQ
jgi:hypothetical protein